MLSAGWRSEFKCLEPSVRQAIHIIYHDKGKGENGFKYKPQNHQDQHERQFEQIPDYFLP